MLSNKKRALVIGVEGAPWIATYLRLFDVILPKTGGDFNG